ADGVENADLEPFSGMVGEPVVRRRLCKRRDLLRNRRRFFGQHRLAARCDHAHSSMILIPQVKPASLAPGLPCPEWEGEDRRRVVKELTLATGKAGATIYTGEL